MSNNKYISLNVANNGGGGGGGDIDSGAVLSIVNSAITDFSNDLQEGEPIVGMAAQLYSPDGVTTEGAFTYRTTGGDKDVSTGNAELRKIEGNSIYPELQYNDSAALEREGSEVTGFTYEIGAYSVWNVVEPNSDIETKSARIKRNNKTFGYWHFSGDNVNVSMIADETSFHIEYGATAITTNEWTVNGGSLSYDTDTDWLTLTLTGETNVIRKIWVDFATVDSDGFEALDEVTEIDIPIGETTYVFAIDENNVLGAWTPALPQAIHNMKIDGADYAPQDGDEITITRNASRQGRAQFANPRTFVSVGLNSFNKDADTPISTIIGEGWYAVKGVTGLEKGYTIYDENSGITAVGLNSTPDSTGAELLESVDAALNYITPTTAKPWIVFQVSNADKVCVHPRWSGYNDLVYEPYTESKIEGLFSIVVNCPMWSVGNVRNIIDIENGQIIRNIGSENYSAARVNELLASGYTLGVDFDFDSALIYKVLDTPVIIAITFDGSYDANDFGVEYFVDENGIIPTPVYAETYYMQNLVDKLRRMEGLVHLDSLSGTGASNTLYECDGKLYMWSDEGGTAAEWTTPVNENDDEGWGLIYSYIPNGQVLFDFKYRFGSKWRSIVMSGETLVLLEEDGTTVVDTCNYGETKDWRSGDNNSVYGKAQIKYEKNWIGVYCTGYRNMRNVWDGNVNGGHFEIVDHTNYPYFNTNSTSEGIPKWNYKGQIIGQKTGYQTKNLRFNTTGYGNTMQIIIASNNNAPERIWVPTTGGTAGQMLISAGDNAEPTWSNWIKSVQITSDAYDALVQAGTTDPNTLYLITD